MNRLELWLKTGDIHRQTKQVRVRALPLEPFSLCFLPNDLRFGMGRLAGHCQRFCQQPGSADHNSATIRTDLARIRRQLANGPPPPSCILTTD
jgi:hypothetical protein